MKSQTAKKDHKCDLCDKKIPKGDVYRSGVFFVGYEYGNTRKEHTDCELYSKNNSEGDKN